MKLSEIIKHCLDYRYFDFLSCSAEINDSKLFAVTGENATGKSFFCKLLDSYSIKNKIVQEVIRVGMGKRTESGIVKALMFGDENTHSTGGISFNTIKTGIRTSKGRKHNHILIFDEPDIGMSDSYAAAMGNYIAVFANNIPEHCIGLGIVSHSKVLLSKLALLNPTHLRFGDNLTLNDWLKNPTPEKSLKELEELSNIGLKLFREIQSLINEKGKNKK